MATYSFWLASNRTWDFNFSQMPYGFSGTYFRNQAIAMLHGRLSVPEFSFANECVYRDGLCYGYFGLLPSIVRLPFFLLFRSTTLTLAPLSIAIAAGIGTWSSLDILRQSLNTKTSEFLGVTNRRLTFILGALLLGSGGALTTLSQAKVYREAIIWMVACILLAFAMALRWMESGSNSHLILTLIAAVGATNSRPSAIPPMIGLGIWIYLKHHRRDSTLQISLSSISFAILVLPAATALFVFFLKFRALYPPTKQSAGYSSEAVQRYLRLNNGVLQGPRFSVTNLVQYFRPDSVRYSRARPWAHVLVPNERAPILVSPVKPGGMYFEPTASITNTMPVQMALTMVAVVPGLAKWKLKNLAVSIHGRILVLLAASTPLLVITTWSNTGRYVGDFFPLIAVGTIAGGVSLLVHTSNSRHLRTWLYVLIAVAGYFTLVQFSLNVEGWKYLG